MSREAGYPSVVAYGDESFRELPDGTGAYVLAASLVQEEQQDAARVVMRQLARRQAGTKLHWRELTSIEKVKAIEDVAALRLVHLVAVGFPLVPRQQERARRKCMFILLPLLQEWGVTHFYPERRSHSLNKKDITTVMQCRASRTVDVSLTLCHILPSTEPLAWLPDLVAGAFAKAWSGDDVYAKILSASAIEIEVEL